MVVFVADSSSSFPWITSPQELTPEDRVLLGLTRPQGDIDVTTSAELLHDRFRKLVQRGVVQCPDGLSSKTRQPVSDRLNEIQRILQTHRTKEPAHAEDEEEHRRAQVVLNRLAAAERLERQRERQEDARALLRAQAMAQRYAHMIPGTWNDDRAEHLDTLPTNTRFHQRPVQWEERQSVCDQVVSTDASNEMIDLPDSVSEPMPRFRRFDIHDFLRQQVHNDRIMASTTDGQVEDWSSSPSRAITRRCRRPSSDAKREITTCELYRWKHSLEYLQETVTTSTKKRRKR
jgi:acid stress-induced BolA-like protein IbaG/YrbA